MDYDEGIIKRNLEIYKHEEKMAMTILRKNRCRKWELNRPCEIVDGVCELHGEDALAKE